ncbi:MAG: energy transducer TonB [Thermodesulfovibrionales bacterium]
MTRFRRNIVFSLLLHVTIITAAFSFFCRGTSFRAPAQYMMVFLLREITSIEETASPVNTAPQMKNKNPDREVNKHSVPDNNKKAFTEQQEETDKNTSQNTAGITESVAPINRFSGIPKETYLPNTPADTLESTPSSISIGKGGLSTLSVHTIAAQSKEDVYASIRNAVERVKIYPLLARKRKIEGTVIMEFIINNKGYPQDIRIEKSSEHEILDSAAIKTVKNAAPLPHIQGKIIIPIRFKLTDYQTYTYR